LPDSLLDNLVPAAVAVAVAAAAAAAEVAEAEAPLLSFLLGLGLDSRSFFLDFESERLPLMALVIRCTVRSIDSCRLDTLGDFESPPLTTSGDDDLLLRLPLSQTVFLVPAAAAAAAALLQLSNWARFLTALHSGLGLKVDGAAADGSDDDVMDDVMDSSSFSCSGPSSGMVG